MSPPSWAQFNEGELPDRGSHLSIVKRFFESSSFDSRSMKKEVWDLGELFFAQCFTMEKHWIYAVTIWIMLLSYKQVPLVVQCFAQSELPSVCVWWWWWWVQTSMQRVSRFNNPCGRSRWQRPTHDVCPYFCLADGLPVGIYPQWVLMFIWCYKGNKFIFFPLTMTARSASDINVKFVPLTRLPRWANASS